MRLNDIISDYKITVDTCSLRTKGSTKFFNELEYKLIAKNKKIIIYKVVINELKKYITNTEVRKANKILYEYNKYNLIDFKNTQDKTFADNAFLTVFTKFRRTHNLCLITQDKALIQDILNLNKSNSVEKIKNIVVLTITPNGEYKIIKHKEHINKKKKEFSFKIGTQVIKNETQIEIEKIPRESDIIQDKNQKSFQLQECIGHGGEGNIYKINDNMVCKIYKKNKLLREKEDKLKLMMKGNLICSGITFPQRLVYSDGKFVGYIMEKANGSILQNILIKPVLIKKFPNWKKSNLVDLSLQILKKIEYLHSKNIIIGDINLQNILLSKNNKIYFVDTDSYQVENYPCKVGTIAFTPPELQNKSYRNFLRSKKHENFAIAILLFMILLPGKHPYSQQGGTTPAENIKKGNFSYPLGKISNKKTPNGPWKYLWSNLPYNLKEAFYEVFKNGTRYDVGDWIKLLKLYKENLNNNFVSNEMFPERHKELTEYAKQKFKGNI